MNSNQKPPSGMMSINPNDITRLVQQLQADQQKLAQDVTALSQASNQTSPGVPPCQKQQPFSYSVEIPLPAGANSRIPGTFTTSQDGPFVALAMQAAWRETQGAYAGRWLPPSSVELYIRSV